MRILFLLLTLAVFIFNNSISAKESLYLMPRDSKLAVDSLCEDIKNAKKEIKIAIYSFTHNDIAKAIKKAAKNGAKVEIIFDKESNGKKSGSQIGNLAKIKNIDVYTIKGKEDKKKKYRGKMHMKTAIIDGKNIYFGSANWSYSAFSKNYETLYKSDSKEVIERSIEFFDEMLKSSTRY